MSPKKKIRAEHKDEEIKDEDLKKEEVTKEEDDGEDENVKGEEVKEEVVEPEAHDDSKVAEATNGAMPVVEASEQRQLTPRLDDIQPSDWFRKKWQEWQKDLQVWHEKHIEYKHPNMAKAGQMGALCKAAPAAKPVPQKKPDKVKKETEAKKDEDAGVQDDKDPMQQLEEEIDREDIDIFGIQDACDRGGDAPLFSNFAFEDWALLSLRFELHLLVHAFMHDAKDAERKGIHPEHLSFYYDKYFQRGLNPKKYGVESVDDVIDLVKDTILIGARTKNVESQLAADIECNEVFIKLTERGRRDRQRRIDAGEEKAALKFSRPARFNATPAPALTAGSTSGEIGGPTMPAVVPPKQWAKAGGNFNAGVRPSGVVVPPVKAPPMGGPGNTWQGMHGGYNSYGSWNG